MKKNIILLLAAATLMGASHPAGKVPVYDCACKIYIPNAFSPNRDGQNDDFRPYTDCTILAYELQIFNRWSTLVYQGRSIEEGWDGNVKGQPASLGVYLCRLELSYATGEITEKEIKTGDLTR